MRILHPSRPLFWILLLAAALRLNGITWGAPDAMHAWPYHPDEPKLFLGLMKFPRLEAVHGPTGCTYFLLYGFHTVVGAILQLFPGTTSRAAWEADPAALHSLYVWNRLLSVALGLAAIGVLHSWALKIANDRVAWIAALSLAIMPHAVVTQHFCTQHSLVLLLNLLFMRSLYLVSVGEPRERITGFWAVTSTAAEYSLGIMIIVSLYLVLRKKRSVTRLLQGFAIALPLFMNLPWSFSSQIGGYLSRWGHYLGLSFGDLPSILIPAVSLSFLVAGLGGIAGLATLTARKKEFRPILAYAAIYFAVYFFIGHALARRFLPLFPLLALGTGWLLSRLARGPIVLALLVIAVAAEPAIRTAAVSRAWVNSDTRSFAKTRVDALLPEGSPIMIQNWFFAPHISMKRYSVQMNPHGTVPADTGSYILTSDRNDPHPATLLAHGYRELLLIREPHRIGGIVFDDETWPEDMRYVNPTIYLFGPLGSNN